MSGRAEGIRRKQGPGAGRASEVMMAALIARLLPMEAAEAAKFDRFLHPVMKNWNGITVGRLRPTFS